MKIRRGRWFIILLILAAVAMMVACTRPARPGDDATATPDTTVPGVVTSTVPAETGGVATTTTDTVGAIDTATPIAVATEVTPPQPTDQTPTVTVEGGGDTGTAATATPETTTEDTATPAATEGEATATPVPTADTSVAQPTATATTGATTAPTTGTHPTTEVSHTVQPGENLYRIGLQYGYSWAVLAQYNNITNPNLLTVGQVIKIPAAGVTPTPTVPTEVLYTVKQGDTLGRIAAAYGISWVQIAEANGIVNPNLIYPGQVLKIPSNTPGPAPQFTHVVKQGETLFLISLHYGVLWTDIAAANNITAPYVIFPGQTLTIPGGN